MKDPNDPKAVLGVGDNGRHTELSKLNRLEREAAEAAASGNTRRARKLAKDLARKQEKYFSTYVP